jgi:hypothetical protein
MLVGDTNRSLLIFNLSSIPVGSTVTSAELVLCFSSILSASAGRTHEMNRVSASWTELGVTWNNQPGGNSGQAITWQVPSLTGCISIDVKTPVEAWVTSGSNLGWRISDQGENGGILNEVQYATRENGVAGRRPTLNTTYTTP